MREAKKKFAIESSKKYKKNMAAHAYQKVEQAWYRAIENAKLWTSGLDSAGIDNIISDQKSVLNNFLLLFNQFNASF